MKKIIKKIGDSAGIIFNSEERKINNIFIGKIVKVDIKDDVVVIDELKEVEAKNVN